MGNYDDWRERHGPKQSGNRVIIYILLLLLILLFMAKAGDFSSRFADIFMGTSENTGSPVDSTE